MKLPDALTSFSICFHTTFFNSDLISIFLGRSRGACNLARIVPGRWLKKMSGRRERWPRKSCGLQKSCILGFFPCTQQLQLHEVARLRVEGGEGFVHQWNPWIHRQDAGRLTRYWRDQELIFQRESFSNDDTGTTLANMEMQPRTISFLGKIFSGFRYLYNSGSAPLSARV